MKILSQYSSSPFSFLNGPENGFELPLPDTTGQKTVFVLGKVTKALMGNVT